MTHQSPRRLSRWVVLGLISLVAVVASGSVAGALAATPSKVGQVAVRDDSFSPTRVKIKPGQTVTWKWDSANLDAHNVTLAKGPAGVSTKQFTSKTKVHNYTFKLKFKIAGKYRFICTIHPFMVTTVTVKK